MPGALGGMRRAGRSGIVCEAAPEIEILFGATVDIRGDFFALAGAEDDTVIRSAPLPFEPLACDGSSLIAHHHFLVCEFVLKSSEVQVFDGLLPVGIRCLP